jgi:ABC-type nitrate/sulfonate/bicarbonate transport system permease component
MAETGRLTAPLASAPALNPVTKLRIALIAALLLLWEATAASGLLFRDVVPSLATVARAVATTLTHPDTPLAIDIGFGTMRLKGTFWVPEFYGHLWTTIYEVALALVIGGLAGLVVGIVLGANRFLSNAFEHFLYYLGPTPKIIFFPIMIMWFGVGPGSKVAMGTISCFFPIALSAAAALRQIDRVLIRVGRSFRANAWQMATKIYLPAMRAPIVNGVRLGLGVAIIGTLLAETKLSNRGLGFLVINAYTTFDMPKMYSLLILLFAIAIGVNALVTRLGALDTIRTR